MLNAVNTGFSLCGFRVSRIARERYQFNPSLFTPTGNVAFATIRQARIFAQQMNARRQHSPAQTVKAGQLNAMALIDEIMRYIVYQYQRQLHPTALAGMLDWLDTHLDRETIDATLCRLAEVYPPGAVYAGEMTAEAYLRGETDGVAHRMLLARELLMLWLGNMNHAYGPYLELFDDAPLQRDTEYLRLIEAMQEYFTTQPPFGPDNQPLVAMLRSPAIAVPHSLSGQLEYIISRWGYLLGEYLQRLLASLDIIKEEEKAIFLGPGPSLVPDYAGMPEYERFSQDRDWMPRLVMMAKNTYVWLDQLSKRYGRAINKLDHIPDEELDRLARWGFTGLWLIGVWERSIASQRIKQWCGNPEAVASAYSLMGYDVANDLGGPEALERLKARAWQRGIRLASDMVPNHMGIDSQWVIEHPDWFVGLDYSPFPSYSFNGGDLSTDGRVGIFIEDHYYSRNDAAVVFKRVDRWTGSTKYIYHGNDGTSMPWNDTAQLNYLIAEVREAVIQTILHVARQFPIIRFDAAMTLAKKHYQRLWFPQPGTGGAIPSRAEHGVNHEQFDAVFPQEFWREVVDRVAQEAPDTLLLAEAFWLMEGYFVRTLGMHRVYNSAFMNMLRDEDNAKFRSVMKNTMEFDPEIMKRFVNFMNNPDERTAIDQFGTGDKYFGICTMMATMPGLPMFGHGQIEGFSEKYGMEYRRAYWDEQVNDGLVWRHEREIFPLLHRRHIFSDAQNFRLYDFYSPEGYVNEDVFAYSNRAGGERGLVVYHNKFASACGWIRTSAAVLDKSGGERKLIQNNLGEGLGLRAEGNCYTIFRDHANNLEYIRPSREIFEKGLYVELDAYKCHVFLDFREVSDNAWGHYGQVCAQLNGQGVPSVDDAVRELYLRPIHGPYRALVNAETFRRLIAARVMLPQNQLDPALLAEIEERTVSLLRAVKHFTGGSGDETAVAAQLRGELAAILQLPTVTGRYPMLLTQEGLELDDAEDDAAHWGVLFGWLFTHALGRMISEEDAAGQSRAWMDEWLLAKILTGVFRECGLDDGAAWQAATLVKLLTSEQDWPRQEATAPALLARWLQDEDAQQLLHINRFQDVLWFNQQGFAALHRWLGLLAVTTLTADETALPTDIEKALERCGQILHTIRQAVMTAEYQVEKLLAAVQATEPEESLIEA